MSNPHPKDEKYELHRLIGTVFSLELTEQEKIDIFEQEYDIDCNPDVRSEVRLMCNLSQGIKEAGIKEGIKARETQTVLNMYKKNYPLSEIASVTELPLDKVQEIVDQAMAQV